jgi:hypothetical protein
MIEFLVKENNSAADIITCITCLHEHQQCQKAGEKFERWKHEYHRSTMLWLTEKYHHTMSRKIMHHDRETAEQLSIGYCAV